MHYLAILVLYWLLLFHKIIFNPYCLAYGEGLDCDFSTQRLCGEYWRKFKIPKDPYYFGNLIGARAGTLYPINIIFAYISSFFKLDTAWIFHVYNILLHSLATSIFAYYLFGEGLIGLFGALAWGYFGYHIKQNLWYVQAFTWITATLCFASQPILAGISLGMLFLCGTPPLVAYFIYCGLLTLKLSPLALLYGVIISLPQLIVYLCYYPKSIRSKHGYKGKVAVGRVKPWAYLFTFIPFRNTYYWFDVGFWEVAFFMTPIVVFFALFGNPIGWVFVLVAILLSYGGSVFKLLSPIMFRGSQRWGYFACLGIIMLGVEGLAKFNLLPLIYIYLNIALGAMLLFNRYLLPIYPFAQWTKKPSAWFETPMLKWLEANAKGYRVNNLPYPVYSGQINHIRSMGYCGGNHLKWLGKLRNIPIQGAGGYDWFEFKEDGKELDKFGVKYHIGYRPKGVKWIKIRGLEVYESIYCNTSI